MKTSLLLLAGMLAVLPAVRAADRDDRDFDRREPQVILYEHADFRGDALALRPGEFIENFSGRTFPGGSALNDRVSSIRVEPGAVALLYENGRFCGQVLRLTESVRDLSRLRLPDNPELSWNDRISSIRVEPGRRPHGHDRDPVPETVIRQAYLDLLGREPDPAGLRYYRVLIIDQGWTAAMVRDHLRDSEEFRRVGADRIIRRAYQDLLGREPDEGGLRHYRQQLVERRWSETELRDNIRRSPEYLDRVRNTKPRG